MFFHILPLVYTITHCARQAGRYRCLVWLWVAMIAWCSAATAAPSGNTSLVLRKTITGQISPKSVVHSGNGLFFAQNMMYNHTVTVYNRRYELVKTISDAVRLSDYGFTEYSGNYKGAPVEVAFSHGGKYAWVSNYLMHGKGFSRAGEDDCPKSDCYDPSFLYKINTQSLEIEAVVKVGSVPKYVAVSPNNRYVLVTNWCSGDVSVVDAAQNKEINRIDLGAHPRGIVIDQQSQHAYMAIMGGTKVADLNLQTMQLSWLGSVGLTPRHLCLDPVYNRYLYATLNNEGKVVKVDLKTRKVVQKCASGKAPRSMVISANGAYLYVVNYLSNTLSKIRTADMSVVEQHKTNHHPIGITYDADQRTIWVACYSGSIMVFEDTERDTPLAATAPPASLVAEPNTALLPPAAAHQSSSSSAVATTTPARKHNKKTAVASDNSPQCAATESYHIVIASFDKEKIAQKAALELRQKNIDASVLPDPASQRYRVVYGCYATEAEARNELPKARQNINKGAWILHE